VPLPLGETWEWEVGDGKVSGSATVLGYRQRVALDAPTPEEDSGAESKGYVWAALEVKVCNNPTSADPIIVSNTPWVLAYADGAQIQPSSTTYDAFPRPEFPIGDTQLAAGRCIQGETVYPVPGDQRPTAAVYAPEGLEEPTEWTIPAN
jgi:hypothetical protein